MTLRIVAVLAFLALPATGPHSALAHHAFSAEFDANLPIRVQGPITRVDWINPHAWVHVGHRNADGTTTHWRLEGGPPKTLAHRGLTREILRPGTEVVVRGYQSKDRVCDPVCWGSGREIAFRDGFRFFMGSAGTGAPRDGTEAPPRR